MKKNSVHYFGVCWYWNGGNRCRTSNTADISVFDASCFLFCQILKKAGYVV